MFSRILVLAGCFFLISCSKEAQNPQIPLEKVGNAYELHVDKKWATELRRPLPEMLIFDKDRQCIYFSTGFAEESFAKDMSDIFNKKGSEDFDVEKFETDHPETAQNIRSAINKNLADLDTDTQQDAYEEALADVARQLNEQNGLARSACTSSISQHLSLLQDSNGQSVTLDILEKEKFTIIEYWADWCLPCKQQRKALDKFIDQHNVDVTFLHVERDATKL